MQFSPSALSGWPIRTGARSWPVTLVTNQINQILRTGTTPRPTPKLLPAQARGFIAKTRHPTWFIRRRPIVTRAFVCFIISFLWLRNIVKWNIKWSVVCSSSSHGQIGLSVSPNLRRYDLILPCPVIIVVNSENTRIFCRGLFLTDGKIALVTAPFPVFVHYCCHISSQFSLSCVTITSIGILYATGPNSTAASFASLSTSSFTCIPACPFTQPKCIIFTIVYNY